MEAEGEGIATNCYYSTSKGILQDRRIGNMRWITQVDLGFQQEAEVITKLLHSRLDTLWGFPYGKPLSFLQKEKF